VGTGNSSFDKISIALSSMNASNALGINASIGGASGGIAQAMLSKLDTAIDKVSKTRAGLGAIQNRLQSTINNLQVAVENTSAAQSRIADADIASETAAMTRANILTQAGTSILAQANQAPQTALSLLQ